MAETIVVVDPDDPSPTAAIASAGGARVVVAPPLPDGWVGKPWALQHGLEAAGGAVLVTLDADTRPRPGLFAALVRELEDGADLVTAGTRFVCETAGERLLHPAMLATLVYRFGPAGAEDVGPARAHRAMANGQCQAFRREQLLAAGGFARAPDRMTDDIALARSLAADGWRVRFLDGADLISVRMHSSMPEVWREWGRSLSMQDVTPRGWQGLDLLVLWLAMALPLLRVLARRANALDALLATVRVALLIPLRRVYERRGLAFWLSPLADIVAATRLTLSTLRPIRTWRGRTYPVQRGHDGAGPDGILRDDAMAKRDPRMIPVGYGKFVRADRIFALVPLEPAERGEGRRTYVHVDGLSEPIVASRSERAILADAEAALAEAAGVPRRSARRAREQDGLF